jgi:hypothetical protein
MNSILKGSEIHDTTCIIYRLSTNFQNYMSEKIVLDKLYFRSSVMKERNKGEEKERKKEPEEKSFIVAFNV